MDKILLFVRQKMALYLRRRGWVVFYLEKEARFCNAGCCWLGLYESEEIENGDKPNV
jgi:hypothetical protein